MIDLNTEQKTMLAVIHFASGSKGFTRGGAYDPKSEYADPIMSFYAEFGKAEGLEDIAALMWGLRNVEFHRPTLLLVVELNDDVFADMTPELRRDAVIVTLNDLHTRYLCAEANKAMDEESFYA